MSDGASAGAGDAGPSWRTLVGIGALLVAIGSAILLDAAKLPAPSAVGVGPSAAMRLVAAFVAILGVAHWIAAWRLRARMPSGRSPGSPQSHGNLASVAWVLGGLFGLVALLQVGGGFIAAATWLFVATARGFGQPVAPKSVIVGLVLTSLVYLFFTKALALGLPAGPLERLFT